MNSLKSTYGKWVHGMANVTFEDYTMEVQAKIADCIEPALEECAGEMITRIHRNYDKFPRVDTGDTKNSFQYRVTGSVFAGEWRADIGSNYENAIWEEFGTGEHALNQDGRKGGWVYRDAEGIWHYTKGKKPSRAFFNAYVKFKNGIIKRLQDSLKGMG